MSHIVLPLWALDWIGQVMAMLSLRKRSQLSSCMATRWLGLWKRWWEDGGYGRVCGRTLLNYDPDRMVFKVQESQFIQADSADSGLECLGPVSGEVSGRWSHRYVVF